MPTLTELLEQELNKSKKKGVNVWIGQQREERPKGSSKQSEKKRTKPKAPPQTKPPKIIKTNKPIADALPKFLNSFYEHYRLWLKNHNYHLSTQTTKDNVVILLPDKKTTMNFKTLFEFNFWKWIDNIFYEVWDVLDFEYITREENKDKHSPYNPIRMYGHFTYCSEKLILLILDHLDQHLTDKQKHLKAFYYDNLKMFKMLYLRLNKKAGNSIDYYINTTQIKIGLQSFFNCFDQWELIKIKQYIESANQKMFKEYAKIKRASIKPDII